MYKVRIERRFRELYPSDFDDMTELYNIDEVRQFNGIKDDELKLCEKLSKNKSIIGFSKVRRFFNDNPKFSQIYMEMVDMYGTMMDNHEKEQARQARQTVRVNPRYGDWSVSSDSAVAVRGDVIRSERGRRRDFTRDDIPTDDARRIAESAIREYAQNFAPITCSTTEAVAFDSEALDGAIHNVQVPNLPYIPLNTRPRR